MSFSYLNESQVPHDHLPHVLGRVHLTNISLKGETWVHKVNKSLSARVCVCVSEISRVGCRVGWGGVRWKSHCLEELSSDCSDGTKRQQHPSTHTRTHTQWYECLFTEHSYHQNRGSPLLPHLTFTSAAESKTSGHIKNVQVRVWGSPQSRLANKGATQTAVCVSISLSRTFQRLGFLRVERGSLYVWRESHDAFQLIFIFSLFSHFIRPSRARKSCRTVLILDFSDEQ